MNDRKPLLIILLMLVFVVSILPVNVFAAEYTTTQKEWTGEEIKFKYNSIEDNRYISLFYIGKTATDANEGYYYLLIWHNEHLQLRATNGRIQTSDSQMYIVKTEDLETANKYMFDTSLSAIDIPSTATTTYGFQPIMIDMFEGGAYTGTEGDTTIVPKGIEEYYQYNIVGTEYDTSETITNSFTITINYMDNSTILKTDTLESISSTYTLSDIITAPDGYEIETITINDIEYSINEMTTITEQTNIYVECKVKSATGAGDSNGNTEIPNASLLDDTKLILSEQLAGNKLYTSSMMLIAELENLFAQDYSDKNEFEKINPFKITAGNLAIPNEGTGSYHYSQINWGLNNQEVMNFDWFFGNHPSAPKGNYVNIDGTPAVKAISDPLISSLMWIGFTWWLWHNLPDLIGGTIGQVGSFTAGIAQDSYKNYATTRDKQEKYNKRYKEGKKGGGK